ncbi:MAG: hypothetical protein RMJ98_13760, partial [Myxococcales bacterium]|nr:hypothetical protein [Polyangiaceae bacterium]MDW8250357.1 hypothetical protein [Myxococcales bacterium]
MLLASASHHEDSEAFVPRSDHRLPLGGLLPGLDCSRSYAPTQEYRVMSGCYPTMASPKDK